MYLFFEIFLAKVCDPVIPPEKKKKKSPRPPHCAPRCGASARPRSRSSWGAPGAPRCPPPTAGWKRGDVGGWKRGVLRCWSFKEKNAMKYYVCNAGMKWLRIVEIDVWRNWWLPEGLANPKSRTRLTNLQLQTAARFSACQLKLWTDTSWCNPILIHLRVEEPAPKTQTILKCKQTIYNQTERTILLQIEGKKSTAQSTNKAGSF